MPQWTETNVPACLVDPGCPVSHFEPEFPPHAAAAGACDRVRERLTVLLAELGDRGEPALLARAREALAGA